YRRTCNYAFAIAREEIFRSERSLPAVLTRALEYNTKHPPRPLAIGSLKSGRKKLAGGHRKRPMQDARIAGVDIHVDGVTRGIGDESGLESQLGNTKSNIVV